MVTDGDGSTFTRQLGAESPRDSPLRVLTLYYKGDGSRRGLYPGDCFSYIFVI